MAIEINSNEFEKKVIQGKGPVIVDFYSTECPPCEALAPKFEYFSEQFHGKIAFYKMLRQGNKELSLSLGVRSSPTLLFFLNGKEVGERLSGAVKKSSIRKVIKDSFGLVDDISKIVRKEIHTDVAIIGAGPAGLTAGLYASRAKLDTLIIDQGNPGGQVNLTHLVANYPGTEEPINGYMLMHKTTEQVLHNGATIMRAAEITALDLKKKTIDVDDDKRIIARSIILATGSKPRELGLPGEKELFGKGISYCATCDGKFYEGKDILVIGGGNSAVEESIFLAEFAKSITIVHQFDEFQAEKKSAETLLSNPKVKVLWSHEPRAFIGEDSFHILEVEDLKEKKRKKLEGFAGVFVFVGYVPQNSLFDKQVSLNKWGYVQADPQTMAIGMDGVFVAGDVREKIYRQITTAVSDGTIAALSVQNFLRENH